jgi:WbqC-like protein family
MDLHTRESEPWRRKHLDFLGQAFAGAPFAEDARGLCCSVLERPTNRLCDVAIASVQALCDYFEIGPRPLIERSSSLGIEGRGWERVLAIVRHLGGDIYVSGLGGRNYIAHEAFDQASVRIEYMHYLKTPYPQLHGAFTPFVSALDLVANLGRAGRTLISSPAVYWKESLDE